MTMADRAASYARTFPMRPPLQVVQEGGADVLYGVWVIGADYRNRSTFYGSYPVGYLARVAALFPDVTDAETLHVFSGSLAAGQYRRCDAVQEAEYQCSVYDLPARVAGETWPLVLADPPYSAADAEKYGTPMVNRGKVLRALAQVTAPGRHLVWLDTVWPMHRKAEWRTAGRILLQRSTNHRVRLVSIFERVA